MNLTECYFCGMLNSYLYYCRRCENYSSTTGGSSTCSKCKQKKKKVCFNDDCVTNKKELVEEFNNKKNGVMDKNSPSTTSQSHCINCGSDKNFYSSSLVYLKEVDQDTQIKIDEEIKKYDALIFVKKDCTKYLVLNRNSKKEDLKKFKDEIDLNALF